MRGILFLAIVISGCVDPDNQDYDQDGVLGAADCDDHNATVYPGAPEACDGIDNDCDGAIDDADPDVDLTTERTFYADLDGDGFGAPGVPRTACTPPEDHVLNDLDCDDGNGSVHPDATEICNDDVDDDCNGFADDADPGLDPATGATFYADLDGDGFGDPDQPILACTLPAESSENDLDCADLDVSVHPDATEICNGIDDDCDTLIDDADDSRDLTGAATFYADTDDDTFGDPDTPVVACTAPEGYVDDSSDCGPTDNAVNPLALEVCNGGVDDDCNGVADDDDPYLDDTSATQYFRDLDRDGYGSDTWWAYLCEPVDNYDTTLGGDCWDRDPYRHPDAGDPCNGFDDDCDPSTPDDGVWWFDWTTQTMVDYTADFEGGTAASPYEFAPTGPGSIALCPGTYHARIESNEQVNVLAELTLDPAILDGGFDTNGDASPLITLGSTNRHYVYGVTLRNAAGGISALRTDLTMVGVSCEDMPEATLPFVDHEAGILDIDDLTVDNCARGIESSDAEVTIDNASFANSDAMISMFQSDVDINDTSFVDNDATFGSPVFLSGGTLDMQRVSFDRNSGYAIVSASLSPMTLTDVDFQDNVTSVGALTTFSVDGSIEDATFLRNESSGRGGGSSHTSSDLTFTNVDYDENESGDQGGGLYMDGGFFTSTVTFEDVNLRDNVAAGDGGGLFLDEMVADFDGVVVTGNSADNGGGVAMTASEADLQTSVDIERNVASGLGGGVYAATSTLDGTGVDINDNEAAFGGGIYNSEGGGWIIGSDISGNEALGSGGGIMVFSPSTNLDSYLFTVETSTVESNVANWDGGGLYLHGNDVLDLFDSQVDLNVATAGAGVYGTGGNGIIFCTGSSSAATVSFYGNSASNGGLGSAIFTSNTTTYVDAFETIVEEIGVDVFDCDLGVAGTANDNTVHDVYLGLTEIDCTTGTCVYTVSGQSYAYGDNEFFCFGADCP